MAAHRLRAHLRFQPGSGMAAWMKAQQDVRLGQAYHLNAGTAAEERSQHSVDGDVYACDVTYPTRALAVDTWATLTAASVLAWLRPDVPGAESSWADMHVCQHDEGGPCPAPEWTWP